MELSKVESNGMGQVESKSFLLEKQGFGKEIKIVKKPSHRRPTANGNFNENM